MKEKPSQNLPQDTNKSNPSSRAALHPLQRFERLKRSFEVIDGLAAAVRFLYLLNKNKIVFSPIWQQHIGAPGNFVSTANIQSAISFNNGQGFFILTHLREVYYLPRHCLLGESHVRLLEVCTRHFT